MFRRKFNAPIEPGRTFYVIGDVHGMHDHLVGLVEEIDADAARTDGALPTIVLVGDYTDRGLHSRETLDYLIETKAARGDSFITLVGNHDQYILKFITDPVGARRWLHLGGIETLFSFGLRLTSTSSDEDLAATAPPFADALGTERLEFLRSLPLTYQSGNVFVSHAGADPDRPLDDQDPHDLVWIRNMKRPRKDGNWIVHGHTIQQEANITDGRVAIDTGAFYSGILTAVKVSAGEFTFIDYRT